MSNLRAARKTRPDSFQVTPEHVKRLDGIGMEWDARIAKWDLAYEHAAAYAKATATCCRRPPTAAKTALVWATGSAGCARPARKMTRS